ncbi:hypothetical protein ALC56_09181, partial [Trachymyrmex septentrionalis]
GPPSQAVIHPMEIYVPDTHAVLLAAHKDGVEKRDTFKGSLL